MTQMTLLSNITLHVMTFVELKFNLVKWFKGEFDVSQNDEKRTITVLIINIRS